MNAKEQRKLGAPTRRAIVLPALAAAFSLAFTGAASAQTTVFQATINAVNNPLGNVGPCTPTLPPPPTGFVHVFCGSTSIAGYGPAVWTLNVTEFNPGEPSPQCNTYAGYTTFQLLGGGGTLVLDEGNPDPTGTTPATGLTCSPGSSGTSPRRDFFGAPWSSIIAPWTVDSASTGVFARVTSESPGTNTGKSDGPEGALTYTGTLTSTASS